MAQAFPLQNMKQVRRNTPEFKQVAEILETYRKSPQRKKLINLYALKPSQELEEKVLLNKLKKDAATLYDMNFDSILQYLGNKAEKLYRDKNIPLYFFKSSPQSKWLKVPFEFTGKLRKQLFPLSVVK